MRFIQQNGLNPSVWERQEGRAPCGAWLSGCRILFSSAAFQAAFAGGARVFGAAVAG